MSGAIKQALQRLTRDYYYGRIGHDEYRSERRQLLSQLFGAERDTMTRPQTGAAATRRRAVVSPKPVTQPRQPAPVSPALPRPPAQPPDTTRPQAETPPAAQARSPAPRKTESARRKTGPVRRVPWAGMLAIGLSIIAAVAGVVWLSGRDSGSTTEVDPVVIVETPDADARRLVDAFVEKNVWTDPRLDALTEQWLQLTPQQREAARGTRWLSRFERELGDLIDELETVAPLQGDESALELARAIGMPVTVRAPATAPRVPQTAPPASGPEAVAVTPPAEPAPIEEQAPQAPLEEKPPVVQAPAPRAPVATAPAAALTPPPREPEADPAPAPVSEPAVTTPPRVQARACTAGVLNTRSPYCRDTLDDGSNAPRLAVVAPGRFLMGSRWADEEQPVREVAVSRGYAIGRYEVSAADFEKFCTAAGRACPASPWSGGSFPAVNVSWSDAQAYTAWLTEQTGKTYRLPTEAEWEYAARAGSTTRYPSGDELQVTDARFDADTPLANDDRRVNANAWRLFHVVGNVREWVADYWQGDFKGAPADAHSARGGAGRRVAKGGCYRDQAPMVRTASRVGLDAATRDECTGFRVLRELDP